MSAEDWLINRRARCHVTWYPVTFFYVILLNIFVWQIISKNIKTFCIFKSQQKFYQSLKDKIRTKTCNWNFAETDSNRKTTKTYHQENKSGVQNQLKNNHLVFYKWSELLKNINSKSEIVTFTLILTEDRIMTAMFTHLKFYIFLILFMKCLINIFVCI